MKTNVLLNLIKEQDDIDKKILYANYLSEPKYEFLIKKREDVVIKYYQNIDEYNPSRKRKILIVFDGMIAGIMTNKKFQAIIKELFIRCRKANISLVFILFFCSKRCQIKFNTLFDCKNQQQKRVTKYCN